MTLQEQRAAPAGSWASPISVDAIVADSVRLGSPAVADQRVFWLEGRPAEGGRTALVCHDQDGATFDALPANCNVRSRAHEYGGGAYCVVGKRIWFVHYDDQRVYEFDGASLRAVTAEAGCRYADLVADVAHARLICVQEDHGGDGEAETRLVEIALADGRVTPLASGEDFYSNPQLDAAGGRLLWLSWRHPDMPWDRTRLWQADIATDGALTNVRVLVDGDESLFQPQFGPDDRIYFVSDRNDWWNVYRLDGDDVEQLTNERGEFGLPQWVFGMSTYGFVDRRTALAAFTQHGSWRIVRIDLDDKTISALDGWNYTDCQHLAVGNGVAVALAGRRDRPLSVVRIDPLHKRYEVLRRASEVTLDGASLSEPQAWQFASGDGATCHAFFYPPANRDFILPAGEKPPLKVICHGGPTGATTSTLEPRIQYWTSRGFAVLDVNYRGSTGYGRDYRRALYGRWGLADVDDCVNGARSLAAAGLVDGKRMVIAGSSAGGFTVLCALTFHDTFRAGASYYGIGDLFTLAADTHKFESRYTDSLVGPLPEAEAKYFARSPRYHADRIGAPVIFFQGSEDRVVPPNQAETMVAALRAKGLPVSYVVLEGEGHGFRRSDSIRRCLLCELEFYGRVLGFEPAPPRADLKIDNLIDVRQP